MMNTLSAPKPALARELSWKREEPEKFFTVPSKAMPGFCLKVWRTDGQTAPIPEIDRQFIESNPWKKVGVINLRNDWNTPPTTYEMIVQTLPPIPEDVSDTWTPGCA